MYLLFASQERVKFRAFLEDPGKFYHLNNNGKVCSQD